VEEEKLQIIKPTNRKEGPGYCENCLQEEEQIGANHR